MSAVLYVDDDADDRTLLAAACRKAAVSFRLELAESGEQALATLAGRAPSELPALTLLDLKMPGKTGFDVLRALRADDATRDLYVVLYTSSMLSGDVLRARAEGASLFIPKPGGLDELVALARALDAFVQRRDTSGLEARAWMVLAASP